MRLTSRNCSLLLVLQLCVYCTHGASTNPLNGKLSKGTKHNHSLDRKLAKASKSSSKTQSYNAASNNERDEPTDAPTDKPTDGPTNEPTASPSSPSGVLASGNIFDVSDGKQDDPSSDGLEASSATLDIAQHIVAQVSVAFSRSVSSSDFTNTVAKIMTKVIRSYTPFVVYMLDGSRARRELSSTAHLEYDPKFSKVELAYSGAHVSWWTYSIAYKVTKIPEEQEEANEIDDLTQSAVQASILSGLFLKLLTPIAPDVRGVSLPGHELDLDLEPPTNVASGAQPTEAKTRKRSASIGLGFICATLLLVLILMFFVARRRKRRQAREAWAMSMGEQPQTKGKILNAEWTNAYDYHQEEDAPMLATKGAFTLTPRDPPGVYAFESWEHGTVSGTEDADGSLLGLSVGNGSYT